MAEQARGAPAIQDTAMRTLASEIDRKKISAIKKKFDSGADLHLADKEDGTALQRTLRLFRRPEGRNAQRPSSTLEQSRFPIHTSELYEMDVTKLLLTYGANVNTRNLLHGSPIAITVKRGFVKGAKVLLDAGADINHCDDSGATPLTMADKCNQVEVAKLLITAGANASKIKLSEVDNKMRKVLVGET